MDMEQEQQQQQPADVAMADLQDTVEDAASPQDQDGMTIHMNTDMNAHTHADMNAHAHAHAHTHADVHNDASLHAETGTVPVPAPLPIPQEQDEEQHTLNHGHEQNHDPNQGHDSNHAHDQVQVQVLEQQIQEQTHTTETITEQAIAVDVTEPVAIYMDVDTLQAQLQSVKESNAALVNQVNGLIHENNNLKYPHHEHDHDHAADNLSHNLNLNHEAAQDNTSHSSATATAAAAAQLSTYQNALALSESQKQDIVNENLILRQRLVQAGIQISDVISPVHGHGHGHGGVGGHGHGHDHGDVNAHGVSMPVGVAVGGEQGPEAQRKMDGDTVIDITEAEALAAIDPQHHAHVQAHAHAHAQMNAHGHGHGHVVHHEGSTPVVSVPMTPNTAGLSSRSEEKWEMHFARLTQYKNEHGNCLVPTSTELGRWLCRQRHNYRYKNLKEERKQRLMELDKTCLGERIAELGGGSGMIHGHGEAGADGSMPAISTEGGEASLHGHPPPTHALNTKTKYNQAYESKLHAKWDKFYQQLLEYKQENGHCNFPTMNGSLGRWISRQRTLYRSQKLKADRYEKLLSIGFAFEDATALEFKGKLDQQWEAMFQNLLEHKEHKGHCFDVPETLPLGKWLYRQRWLYRHGNLRQDRADKLLAVGFEDKKVLKKNGASGGSVRKKRKREGDVDVDGGIDVGDDGDVDVAGANAVGVGVDGELPQGSEEIAVGDEAVAAAMAAAEDVNVPAMPAVGAIAIKEDQPMDQYTVSAPEGIKAECSGIVEEAGAVAVEAVVGEEVMDESHDAAKAAVQEIVEGVSV
jgi:hypothetical protein